MGEAEDARPDADADVFYDTIPVNESTAIDVWWFFSVIFPGKNVWFENLPFMITSIGATILYRLFIQESYSYL